MSKYNYFQTPKNTSYGAITNAHVNNLRNPLAHYCTCGGSTDIVITKNDLIQVRCTECTSFGVAHANQTVAIYNWNMSKLSQFPARLPILPFSLTSKAKYNPTVLLQIAKRSQKLINDTTDPIQASAINYALKWAQWLTVNHEFLTDGAMNKKLATFSEQFINITERKLSQIQKNYLKIFKRSHQGLNQVSIYRNFLQLHCADVLAKVQAEVVYPNRLIKSV